MACGMCRESYRRWTTRPVPAASPSPRSPKRQAASCPPPHLRQTSSGSEQSDLRRIEDAESGHDHEARVWRCRLDPNAQARRNLDLLPDQLMQIYADAPFVLQHGRQSVLLVPVVVSVSSPRLCSMGNS